MIAFIEQFTVAGDLYGIEDYEQPGDHFLPSLSHRRFRLWRNGGAFAQADRLTDARETLHQYMVAQLSEESTRLSIQLDEVDRAAHELRTRGLDAFLIEQQ